MKHIEMIIDYITDGTDYQYNDNHGVLVRCKDCKHRDPEDHKCDCGHDIMWQLPRADEWFCADGERGDSDDE